MEIKSKEQIINEAKAYLTKTAKHLFVTEKGYYYTIQTFERDGKQYYATFMLNDKEVLINVVEAVTDASYKYHENNSFGIMKTNLFPLYYKAKSIPFFKKMKSIINDAIVEIKVNNPNYLLIEKIKAKLPDLVQEKSI